MSTNSLNTSCTPKTFAVGLAQSLRRVPGFLLHACAWVGAGVFLILGVAECVHFYDFVLRTSGECFPCIFEVPAPLTIASIVSVGWLLGRIGSDRFRFKTSVIWLGIFIGLEFIVVSAIFYLEWASKTSNSLSRAVWHDELTVAANLGLIPYEFFIVAIILVPVAFIGHAIFCAVRHAARLICTEGNKALALKTEAPDES